jgi:hypothetical protein
MTPLARNRNLVIQQADDELLVYDLDTNKAICLNKTSAFIWENCNGNRSFQQIGEAVEKKFGELVSEDFIKFAVEQLKKENLIENKDDVVTDFNGMSRREVIKRIGLGSMVALPIIASLTAPHVNAQASSCNIGASCTCTTTTSASRPTGTACTPTAATACNASIVGMCQCIRSGANGTVTGMCAFTP